MRLGWINKAAASADAGLGSRWPGLVLAILFVLVVVAQGLIHVEMTRLGKPYETWDEIATFNTSYVLSGPEAERVYRYGSLDSALQIVGDFWYENFDPVGRVHLHQRYANTVPASWDDPKVAFKEKDWSWLDYNYFRGADAREPIFISRVLHLVAAYALVLALGLAAVAATGRRAAFVLAPLLLLTVSPQFYLHMAQSLPNGLNGLVSFGVVFFSLLFCDGFKLRYLLASTALVGVGLNLKIDIILMSGAPILAIGYSALRRGLHFAIRAAVAAGLSGLAGLALTDPAFLVDPIANLKPRWRSLGDGAGAGANSPEFGFLNNLNKLGGFVGETFLFAGVPAWIMALPILGAVGVAAIYAVRNWRGRAAILMIGVAVVAVGWFIVLLKAVYGDARYYFNGMGALIACLAAGLVFTYDKGGRWRQASIAVTVVLAGLWCVHAGQRLVEMREQAGAYAKAGGLDPLHNRNLATLEAITRLRTGAYDRQVLVDQHAYIDLHALRAAGFEPRYLNLRNADEVMGRLAGTKPHIVLFSRGELQGGAAKYRTWEGDLPPLEAKGYLEYQRRLLALPQLRVFPGVPHAILSAGPINPNDEIHVAVLAPAAASTAP